MAGVDTIEHGGEASEATLKLMKQKGAALMPTLATTEAYSQYFQGYVPGRSAPTADMRQAETTFRLALKTGVAIGLGSDVGGLPARRELAGTGLDGEGRHDPGAGAHRRHRDQRQDPRPRRQLGARSSPATSPTWWRSTAIRRRTLPAIKGVRFVMKGGTIYRRP